MRIGVDLGGTKIEVIALDDEGAPLLRRRVTTPAGDYLRIVNVIADLIAFVEKELGQKGTVGIATPGAISGSTGFVKNANSTALNGQPFDRDLSRALGRTIRLENDANCFALSEAVDGAAAQADVVFGVILGTGVGGGLVVRKQIINGRNHIAGEWGHNPLPWASDDERPGASCYCGKSGCIETFLSGASLARDYRSRAGKDLTARGIAIAAEADDAIAAKCLNDYQHRLARGLAAVINVVDPDTVVLGGGLSNVAKLYDELPRLIGHYAFSDSIDTPIVRAQHGDSSGVRGAAWLWPAKSE
jgi:predicted NBD/HSP70 family sugar kinase